MSIDKKSFFIGFTVCLLLSTVFIIIPSVEKVQETERLSDEILLKTYFFAGVNQKLLEMNDKSLPEITKIPIYPRYMRSYVLGYDAVAIKFNSSKWDE